MPEGHRPEADHAEEPGGEAAVKLERPLADLAATAGGQRQETGRKTDHRRGGGPRVSCNRRRHAVPPFHPAISGPTVNHGKLTPLPASTKTVPSLRFPTIVTSPIIEPQPDALPPVVQSQIDHPIVHRRSWLTTIAPAYLGVFVWVPFVDALGSVGHNAFGTTVPFVDAVLAVFAGYVLLYKFPARLGWASGQRLPVVASAALGAEGSEWIAGVLYGFFGLVWTAVSIYFSVKLILLGLLSWNLIDVSAVPARQPRRPDA